MVYKTIKRQAVGVVQATVLALLRQYNVHPSRHRGQNFLVDDHVYGDIIKEASLSGQDVVLEIGAGLGTLTERLSPVVKKVVAVELDRKLASILRRRLAYCGNVEVIRQNILNASVSDFGLRQPYKVVANIPYNITGAIFKKFLMQDMQPTAITILVQREVGERIVAKSGKMTLLALSVQLYGTPCFVRTVPASSFYPSPGVDSAILNVFNIHTFPFTDVDEKFFWRVARVGFSAKRKQLHNNLSAGFRILAVKSKAIIKQAGLRPLARAEDLSVEDWHNLTKELRLLLEVR